MVEAVKKQCGNPHCYCNQNEAESHISALPNMNLRDWFAGQALPTLVGATDKRVTPEIIAQVAFQMADAMLAERSK